MLDDLSMFFVFVKLTGVIIDKFEVQKIGMDDFSSFKEKYVGCFVNKSFFQWSNSSLKRNFFNSNSLDTITDRFGLKIDEHFSDANAFPMHIP